MSKTNNHIIIQIFLLLLLISGCTKKSNDIILQIDQFELSKESFIRSYNTGPSVLKFGNDPKLTHLNAIENDYMVSQYLKDQGYGKDSSLSKTLRLFRQELIVEKMFKAEVDDKIAISNDEIREEVLKGKRQVKVKYLFAKDYQEAVDLKNKLNTGTSFKELQESKLLKLGLSTDAGKTGFINHGEVDREINDVIFSLPPNKVSDVIKTNAGYFILKVIDIRRSILSESDIVKLYPTYKTILYSKKMYDESRQYLKKYLDPKEIVVEGKVFKKFINLLYPIYKRNRNSDDVNLEQNQEFFKVEDYKLSEDFLKEKLVTFNRGSYTVEDILYHFSYYPVSFPTTSIQDFAESLKIKIGFRLRDMFLEEEGIKRGYENDPLIKEEIALWKNQIITYRFLQRLSSETEIDTMEVKKIYKEKFKSDVPFSKVQHKFISSYKDYLIYKKLKNIINNEKPNRRTSINASLLNTINVSQSEKKIGVDLFTYKMGLPYSRLAFAAPNRIWAAENVWNSILSIN